MNEAAKKAVVLLSGGLDSATALAIARAEGFVPDAISFRYGQRHIAEIEASRRVSAALGVERHVVVDIDLRVFGGSALTADIDVPKARYLGEMAHGIPITYVPARNTIFLSYALAFAEVFGAAEYFLGVNALDYSGYPDCRPEYVETFERLANLATKALGPSRPDRPAAASLAQAAYPLAMASPAPILPEDIRARVRDGERVELPGDGAAVVPIEDLRLLEAMDDAEDAAEVARRLADPHEVPVPYEDARRRLGLA